MLELALQCSMSVLHAPQLCLGRFQLALVVLLTAAGLFLCLTHTVGSCLLLRVTAPLAFPFNLREPSMCEYVVMWCALSKMMVCINIINIIEYVNMNTLGSRVKVCNTHSKTGYAVHPFVVCASPASFYSIPPPPFIHSIPYTACESRHGALLPVRPTCFPAAACCPHHCTLPPASCMNTCHRHDRGSQWDAWGK